MGYNGGWELIERKRREVRGRELRRTSCAKNYL